MAQTIKIDMDYDTFKRIIWWTVDHQNDAPEIAELYRILSHKLDKMIDHDLYTKTKTAPTPEEREQARQQYLDRKGIPEAFRWSEGGVPT